jgi:hypothetical protein
MAATVCRWSSSRSVMGTGSMPDGTASLQMIGAPGAVARLWIPVALTGRCRLSPPPPGYAPRSGAHSSAATWTVARGSSRCAARSRAAGWSSSPRPRAAGARFRSRPARSRRSSSCRPGSTRPTCSPRARWPCDLANLRRRVWRPAAIASGIREPARLYDLRSTFASNSLAAGVTVFELARLMGTSTTMIERHYGTLVEGAGADIARRLSGVRARSGADRRGGVVTFGRGLGVELKSHVGGVGSTTRRPGQDSNLRPAA